MGADRLARDGVCRTDAAGSLLRPVRVGRAPELLLGLAVLLGMTCVPARANAVRVASLAVATFAQRGDEVSIPELNVPLIDDRPDRLPQKPVAEDFEAVVERADPIDLDLHQRLKDVAVTHTPSGDVVHVETESGTVELTPEEYVRALGATQARFEHSGFLYRFLNISRPWSLVWISVGLLGQLLFTFRMVLQWWASEKHKRSIVPVGFWWGSLFGGALLFAYFCWRKDIVGIIGQSTGVFIYARNLVLIYRGRAIEAEGARPVDEPVADHVPRPRPT